MIGPDRLLDRDAGRRGERPGQRELVAAVPAAQAP